VARLHELDELEEVDPAIPVPVIRIDHALALRVRDAGLEPERREHAPELRGVDEPVAVAVEDRERLAGLLHRRLFLLEQRRRLLEPDGHRAGSGAHQPEHHVHVDGGGGGLSR